MLKKAFYHQFSEDLLGLYCKTKNSDIEKAFIRFAKGTEDFVQWIKNSKKAILSRVSDPSVYYAFEILIDLQGTDFGTNPSNVPAASLSVLLKRFQSSNQNLKTIPVIKTFSGFVDDPSFAEILLPFKNNIVFISKFFREQENLTGIEKERKEKENSKIIADLSIIKNLFAAQGYEEKEQVKKPSILQQRKNMFLYLLNRFSEEISSAFENAGMTEISQKIKSNVLALPIGVGVGSFINLQILPASKTNSINEMVDYVWRHYDSKWGNYNHDLIDVTFLNQSGVITSEEFYAMKSEYEKSKNIMDIFEDSDAPLKGIDSLGNIKLDKKMTPLYIQMVASFFNYLQYKMKI